MLLFSLVLLVTSTHALLTRILPAENNKIQAKCSAGDGIRSFARVMNGIAVKEGDRRYAVAILTELDGKRSQCSGSLISSRHVLTAAHCFQRKGFTTKNNRFIPGQLSKAMKLNASVIVHFGGTCIAQSGDCPADVKENKINKAKRVIILGDYLTSNGEIGDLAIVEMTVKLPVLTSPRLDFVCIPGTTTKVDEELSSAGYGYDPDNQHAAFKILQEAKFSKSADCSLLGAGWDALCTRENEQFMCRGDSGSGVVQANGGRAVIVGVLSKGLDCDSLRDSEKLERIRSSKQEQLRGTWNIDVRKYHAWICLHTGVCRKEDDGVQSWMVPSTVPIVG